MACSYNSLHWWTLDELQLAFQQQKSSLAFVLFLSRKMLNRERSRWDKVPHFLKTLTFQRLLFLTRVRETRHLSSSKDWRSLRLCGRVRRSVAASNLGAGKVFFLLEISLIYLRQLFACTIHGRMLWGWDCKVVYNLFIFLEMYLFLN